MEISLIGVGLGLLLMGIPIYVHYRFHTGQAMPIVISCLRMVVQLLLVGFYLQYLFALNNEWVNVAWLIVMVGVCAFDLLGRVNLSRRLFMPVVGLSVLLSVGAIICYFILVVLQLNSLFESRYFIPLCGSLMGNVLGSNVIGLGTLYQGLEEGKQYYCYQLCNGATIQEALRPFISKAIFSAFNPSIASMAVMGLVSMPGTMIGQIIAGSAPGVAVRYQIMIMVMHFVCSTISLLLIMYTSIRLSLDGYGMLREEAIRPKKRKKAKRQ
jgi:ABC transporter, permease protein